MANSPDAVAEHFDFGCQVVVYARNGSSASLRSHVCPWHDRHRVDSHAIEELKLGDGTVTNELPPHLDVVLHGHLNEILYGVPAIEEVGFPTENRGSQSIAEAAISIRGTRSGSWKLIAAFTLCLPVMLQSLWNEMANYNMNPSFVNIYFFLILYLPISMR